MTGEPVTFETLPSTVGRVVQGEPFTVTAQDTENFERGTWLDKAYPPGEIPEFPETLIEGFHLLSLLDALARMAVGKEASNMWGLNYGLDKVRFVSQVHRGDRVIPTFETLAVEPKDAGYKVLRRCTYTVEGQSRPAMVADWWSYALPRGEFVKGRN
jgi:hypothetical protein